MRYVQYSNYDLLRLSQNCYQYLKPVFFSLVSTTSKSAVGLKTFLYEFQSCNQDTQIYFFSWYPWFSILYTLHTVANTTQDYGRSLNVFQLHFHYQPRFEKCFQSVISFIAGHLRVVFDFGFERQELIFPNKHFGLGQYHDVRISRKNSGATLLMQVSKVSV